MDNNFIFIHIPKTGGRSIKNSIGAPSEAPGGGHLTLQELVDNGSDGVGNTYQENLPVVCFVRNPYDRLVSAFYYRYYEEKHDLRELESDKSPGVPPLYISVTSASDKALDHMLTSSNFPRNV